ncbi:hypothetical protein, partial [Geotoga petraea]|uniref:hypothetical protein n=1 Tax=Geotoga petraea TaxID=28234 RepID=UPI00197AE1F1
HVLGAPPAFTLSQDQTLLPVLFLSSQSFTVFFLVPFLPWLGLYPLVKELLFILLFCFPFKFSFGYESRS